MLVIGADPGKSGAIAFLDHAGDLDVVDMPVSGKEVDAAALAAMVRDRISGRGPAVAYVERVAARPGQGVASMFGFGVSYGLLRGVLAAKLIPVTLVTPREWKSAMRTPAAKDAARARASEVFPAQACLWARKKDDGRAEAALIARFGMTREQATLREMLR
jgi:crossover junction endodeoxyribonuclease RuvC